LIVNIDDLLLKTDGQPTSTLAPGGNLKNGNVKRYGNDERANSICHYGQVNCQNELTKSSPDNLAFGGKSIDFNTITEIRP